MGIRLLKSISHDRLQSVMAYFFKLFRDPKNSYKEPKNTKIFLRGPILCDRSHLQNTSPRVFDFEVLSYTLTSSRR